MEFCYKTYFINKHAFAKFLLDVGESNPTIGRIHNTNLIKIPNDLLIHNDLPNTPEILMNVIFQNIFLEQ